MTSFVVLFDCLLEEYVALEEGPPLLVFLLRLCGNARSPSAQICFQDQDCNISVGLNANEEKGATDEKHLRPLW